MSLRHAVVLTALLTAGAAQGIEMKPMPECAGPDVPAGILVNVTDLPIVGISTVFRVKERITVVLEGKGVFVPGAAQNRLVSFGKLPVGDYEVLVYRRDLDKPPAEHSVYVGSVPLSVTIAAPGTAPCAPATITTAWVGGGLNHAATSTFFDNPVEVIVKDAQNRPVPGVTLSVDVLDQGNGASSVLPTPGVLTTDEQGKALLTASATNTPGVATVAISFAVPAPHPGYRVSTYSVFHTYVAGTTPWNGTVPVISYFSEERNHYFLTANIEEMVLLDAKPAHEWRRVDAFLGFPSDTNLWPPVPVCRYLGLPRAGLDSHFFSASVDECVAVGAKFGTLWKLETNDAFRVLPVNLVTGECLPGSSPVYRLFNNRTDANHLYTARKSVRDAYVAGGYISEGYGPDGVGWCAPQ